MRNFYVTAIPWKSKKLRINYRSILPSIPSIFTRWAEKKRGNRKKNKSSLFHGLREILIIIIPSKIRILFAENCNLINRFLNIRSSIKSRTWLSLDKHKKKEKFKIIPGTQFNSKPPITPVSIRGNVCGCRIFFIESAWTKIKKEKREK